MARTPFRAIATLLLSLTWTLSYAQDNEPYEADPPERAARLSYIEGAVTLQPAGEEDWAPAIVNRPLTTGDKLWVEPTARAEIQVGPAAVRLGSNTGFSFLDVDDDTIQMRITAGVLNVRVRDLRDSEQIEIDTPTVAFSLLRAGNYRVEVNDAGDSTVIKVSEGEVQATGPSQDVIVHAQQVATFTGVDELAARFATLAAPDDFDAWSLERDRRLERVASSRTAEYVAPEVTGYEDLEDNGTWSSEPEYGYVWTPRVVGGWAPYRDGRWVWVSPWGWTWIDDARWGYAPFHYGRWAHLRNRWCWVPGPRHARAVYAPALVGWVGAGAHVSWFPLGPREVYLPRHRYSRYYVERVNYTNTSVNRNHFTHALANRVEDVVYRNRSVPGGLTAMPRSAFTAAGHTGEHRVRGTEQDFSRAVASAVSPRITPVRESRLGGPVRANVRLPPAAIANRQVVVRRDPPQSAAGFARRAPVNADIAQSLSERPVRAPERNRQDRPPRIAQPNMEPGQPARSSVFDRRAISDVVREDRDRQIRQGEQQRNARQQRDALQQREAFQQREVSRQREVNAQRWQREPSPARREVQDQTRERVQRHRDVERPPAVPPPESRVRAERHERSERNTERQPVERPQHAEASRPAESRPQHRARDDGGNTRAKRN